MTTTFGYVNAWAKEPKETAGLKTLLNEYSLPEGLLMSGAITIKSDTAQQLIQYLQDPNNCGAYGIKLDFALFYDESKPVTISGKLTTPYVKGDTTASSTPAKLQSRRSV